MTTYTSALEDYVRKTFATEDEVLSRIREQIPARGLPAITIRPEEGRFLQLLAAASGALRALEIGTLGGYSTVWIARGLPQEGHLITLELNPSHGAVAMEHFVIAGLQDKIDLRVGDAHALLPGLSAEGPFDFIFIDADKTGYPAYLDWSLENLSPGGVVTAHNVFRHGDILDPGISDAATAAVREFNQRLNNDPRLVSTIFPAGDGIGVGVLRK
jgi:predicted O-methyltransferase YrrM